MLQLRRRATLTLLAAIGLVPAAAAQDRTVVTVAARRLLDVATGRMVADPVVRIENGVDTADGRYASSPANDAVSE